MFCVDTIFKMAAVVGLLLLQIGLFGQNKWCSMGENAFHVVFQERWVFSHSSPNPALAARRLWAGYGELVGENSISPGKPCEMHIVSCSVVSVHWFIAKYKLANRKWNLDTTTGLPSSLVLLCMENQMWYHRLFNIISCNLYFCYSEVTPTVSSLNFL